MDTWFYGWSDGEIAFFWFLAAGLACFLAVAAVMAVRSWRERREEREWSSMPPPVLVRLVPPGPPVPVTVADRLAAVGCIKADIEEIKYPPPRLACTVAFTVCEGGCCYCQDGIFIEVFEIGVDRAAWPLVAFCSCGAYQLKEPYRSDLLGARFEWYDDVFEMLADLEEYGPGSIDEARYRLLFEHRDRLQSQVDVLTTALISLDLSVGRRHRERQWRLPTAS